MVAWSETEAGQAKLKALRDNDASLTSLNAYNDMPDSTDACFVAVAQALQNNTALTELSFCYKSAGDDAARAVAQLLRVNKSIKNCVLSMNNFTDGAVAEVARAMEVNASVATLDLGAAGAGDEAL